MVLNADKPQLKLADRQLWRLCQVQDIPFLRLGSEDLEWEEDLPVKHKVNYF
jgi:hypothetical protein